MLARSLENEILNRRLASIGPGHNEWMRERKTGRWFFIEEGPGFGGAAFPMVEKQIWDEHLQLNLLHALITRAFSTKWRVFSTDDFRRRDSQLGKS